MTAAVSAALADFSVQTTRLGRQFLIEQGLDPDHLGGLDPLMPPLLDIDKMAITVAGNAARNQSRAFVGNHGQGIRVTKEIRST